MYEGNGRPEEGAAWKGGPEWRRSLLSTSCRMTARGPCARKAAAEAAARSIAANQGAELIVHRKDGTIQRRDSHGSDPCPPRG